MLTRPKTNDMWYDKLFKSSKGDILLENLSLAADGLSDVKCLVMKKNSKAKPMFSLFVDGCKKKHSAICKYNQEMTKSVPEAPKFPCLAPNHIERRKRATLDDEHQKKWKGQGLLLNYVPCSTKMHYKHVVSACSIVCNNLVDFRQSFDRVVYYNGRNKRR